MYVCAILAQRGVGQEVLVCVGEGWRVRGGVGARGVVTEEAICEGPWRGAGEAVEVRFEGRHQGGSGGGRVGRCVGRRGDEVEPVVNMSVTAMSHYAAMVVTHPLYFIVLIE